MSWFTILVTLISTILPILKQIFDLLNKYEGTPSPRTAQKLENACNLMDDINHTARTKFGIVTRRFTENAA